ncbi:hypothetical protein MF1_10960 [Bartonella quintana]|nr:hypothetical protein MF1_10960 [Bartonella quintana]
MLNGGKGASVRDEVGDVEAARGACAWDKFKRGKFFWFEQESGKLVWFFWGRRCA